MLVRMRGKAHRASALLGAAAAVLALAALWAMNWGCADPRNEPLAMEAPGYSETIPLWVEQPTDGSHIVSADFNVADELTAINSPGVDSPARLRLVAYIVPDCQILRLEHINSTALPFISDSVLLPALVEATNLVGTRTAVKAVVDSLDGVLMTFAQSMLLAYDSAHWDDTYQGVACDYPLYRTVAHYRATAPDTTGRIARLTQVDPTLIPAETRLANAILDTTLLGLERDDLRRTLDNRYSLSFAIDDTNAFIYPNAVYTTGTQFLSGQEIYAAATNTETGMKGCGFLIPLDRIQAADPSNPGNPIQRNWAVCFPGSTQPCLDPGAHKVYVRMPGRSARVTGTLVLVYAQRRP
jgi:hypothetical protein